FDHANAAARCAVGNSSVVNALSTGSTALAPKMLSVIAAVTCQRASNVYVATTPRTPRPNTIAAPPRRPTRSSTGPTANTIGIDTIAAIVIAPPTSPSVHDSSRTA